MNNAQLERLLNEDVNDESLDLLRDMMLFHIPSPSASSDNSASSPKPKTKPKRIRKRESHELAYLREKVIEYTKQLETLKNKKERAAEEASPWESVSRRQASERYVVEQENAKLRQALEQQRDIAQTLLEIVTKRPRIMESSFITDAKIHRLLNEPIDKRRATAEAIVHADYARLESIFLARKLHERTDMIQNTAIAYDETIGNVRMDCTMCETHNVPYQHCASAIWKLYNNLVPIEIKDTRLELLENWGNDVSYGRLTMKTRGTEVQCLIVQKRYIEPDRIVICSSTIAEDEKYPYNKGAYVLHESTWLAIENYGNNKARVKFCSRGCVPCSRKLTKPLENGNELLSNTTNEILPTTTEKALLPHYTALAEFMLSCYQAHFDGIKQALEIMLQPYIEEINDSDNRQSPTTMNNLFMSLSLFSSSMVLGYRMELHRVDAEVPIKRDRENNRKLRRLSDGTFESVPLNLGMGTHYTWVYAGTPPQRASVIVDTGSHIMAFPCSECKTCGKHTDAPFNAALSKTLRYPQCTARPPFSCSACNVDNTCHISQSYTEGSSWEAVVVEDQVWLGDATHNQDLNISNSFGTRFMFGCQKRATGLFTSQVADGIMGVSNSPNNNIVRKLYQEKKIDSNTFSLCFTPTGGTMTLGTPSSTAVTHRTAQLQYAQASTANNGWFAVTVEKLLFGDHDLAVDTNAMNSGRHRVIVDSGTTDSYFPSEYAQVWNEAFLKATGENYQTDDGSCKGYPEDKVNSFPTFKIVLKGTNNNDIILEAPPSLYITKTSGGHLCGNIFFTEGNGGVIGANLMINHEFVFDLDDERVGFAEADCEYRGLMKESKLDGVIASDTPSTITPSTTFRATTAPHSITVNASNSVDTSEPSFTGAVLTRANEKSEANNYFDFSANFSWMFVVVGVSFVLIMVGIVWRLFYRRRSRANQTWTSVPTLQEEAEEEDDHGTLPNEEDAEAGRRASIDEDDEDEFFDSEGYVMSPRSLRKCKEAFEL
ncbi:aspartyl protease family A01B [Thraustotheca clavata]|uniref:Aspartyl protease family A01B n=1 Tax=Thraustotheca clavata TaxID=74557 RepID=A0A1W0A6V7_9STRA|nr:aspartyl protease family A01B [Thraustotheca clavata]